MTGIIRRYNEQRGYGFIQPLIGKPDSTADVYFHITAILGRQPGDRGGVPIGAEVEFDLARGDKGPQAANIRLRRLGGNALTRRESVYTQASTSESGPVAQTTLKQKPPRGPGATAHPPSNAGPLRDSYPKTTSTGADQQ